MSMPIQLEVSKLLSSFPENAQHTGTERVLQTFACTLDFLVEHRQVFSVFSDDVLYIDWGGTSWRIDGIVAGTCIPKERPIVEHDCGHAAVFDKAKAEERERCKDLALAEFVYWRDLCDSTDDAILSHIAMGAGSAASNLLGSILGLLPAKKRKEP